MTREDEKITPALPGLLSTVASGFDIVTGHLWMVTIPIFLDVFYWIGPQLRATTLWQALADLFLEAGTMVDMADQISQLAGHTNLFTFLSVPFLGVPGLMAGLIMPEQTPVDSLVWEVGNVVSWLVLFVVISFAGLLVSTVFHAFIAHAVYRQDPGRRRTIAHNAQVPKPAIFRRLPVYCLRVLFLALMLLILCLFIYVPLALAAAVITLISPALGSMVMFGALVLLIWLIFYLSFGMHGILLKERPVLRALFDSLRFVQRNWLPALALFLLIVGVRNVLAWAWLQVDTGSWLTLVSIAGYAFINTALVAATYVFYRDRIERQEQGFAHE